MINVAKLIKLQGPTEAVEHLGHFKTERLILLDASRVNLYSSAGCTTGMTNSVKGLR